MYLTWVTLSFLKELQIDYIMLLNIKLSNFKVYTLTQVRLMCTCQPCSLPFVNMTFGLYLLAAVSQQIPTHTFFINYLKLSEARARRWINQFKKTKPDLYICLLLMLDIPQQLCALPHESPGFWVAQNSALCALSLTQRSDDLIVSIFPIEEHRNLSSLPHAVCKKKNRKLAPTDVAL